MVITLAAQKGSPLKIGLASSLAISLVAIIGIIIGYFFAIFISILWIKVAGAVIFLIFGSLTIVQLILNHQKSKNPDEGVINSEDSIDTSKINTLKEEKGKRVLIFAFINVFIMEFGDKTQIMTITLAATFFAPFEVGLGAILSLSSLCFLGAYLGGIISKKLPKKWVNLGAALFFILMGIILLIEVLLSI